MLKKVALVLAVCLVFFAAVGCGNADVDLSEINDKLTQIEQEAEKQNAKNKELEDKIKELEEKNKELGGLIDDRTTVFYDWDNPIPVTVKELRDMYSNNYDEYLNTYFNKVVQIIGKVGNTLPGIDGFLDLRGNDDEYIYCYFPTTTSLGGLSKNQTVKIIGLATGGFTSSGRLMSLLMCSYSTEV